ncbi:MAG: hypothetical protein RLY71_449 [Pseudomonadota bacterium]|jgi:hypothetical protein
MQHLLNLLAGLGESLGALGSAPQYRYPRLGDRRADLDHLRSDMGRVGQDLRNTAKRALSNDSGRSHGAIDNSPNPR